MYRWLHFCKYHRQRHPLYLCTINSSVYRHLEITWIGACICWRITTQWNAFWTNTRQIVLDKKALLHVSSVNSRLHQTVFSVLMFENLRFSTSSIFLVFAFPGMCVISVLQDTHFQKDAIIYFSETSAVCLNHFTFKRVCICLGTGSHFRKYLKPSKTVFVSISCCKYVSIKLSVRLPTIDISSMIITFRSLFFILNVFISSADRRCVPRYIFLWKAEQMVWPLILKAAKLM